MTRLKQIPTLTLNPTIDMSSSVESVFPEHKLRCGAAFYEPGDQRKNWRVKDKR